ncbi:MAG: hypothetical protein JNL01_13690 [Bdellovibrionales bacterium]|nr:hypothetical protein [Bdellovibrionales bacterium]
MSQFPWKLFNRFIGGQFLIIVLLLCGAGLSSRWVFKDWFVRQAAQQSQATLVSLSSDVEGDLSSWCAAHSGESLFFSIVEYAPEALHESKALCSTFPERPLKYAGTEWARQDPDLVRAIFNKGFGYGLIKDPADGYPVLLASLVLPKSQVLRTWVPLRQLKEALTFFDRTLIGIFLAIAVCFFVFSILAGRRLVNPLGRLLWKAKLVLPQGKLRSVEVNTTELTDEDLSDRQDGEWADLEEALDQIRWDLKNKNETIERERNELSTLMSGISEAILAVDLEGNPLFFNSRFALMFGGRDIGKRRPRIREIFRAPEILDAFHTALTDGVGKTVETKLLSHAEGLLKNYSISVAPLKRDDGPTYGAVGVFHDVTELKRAEQIRIDFVANVSHELRTPLTSIKGYTDTLLGDFEASGKKPMTASQREDAIDFLNKIQKNCDRLMNLISDLLDLSSLENVPGNQETAKAPISTREITERVMANLERIRTSKEHELQAKYEAEQVLAQPGRLEQVMTNLLENAIKYVPQGGTIRILWEAAPGGGALLRIADNGPGIPLEHQARLFERFYRIDKARSRELGGTGLGLAIVKHIMQVHGGNVFVTSEPGKGAEFVCRFPGNS